MSTTFSPRDGQEATRVLSGRAFAQLMRHATPGGKALLAGDWAAGRILVERPSRPQVHRATGVATHHVALAAKIPPAQRRALDLEAVSLKVLHPRKPSDAELDKLVAKLGLARIWDSLDRLTR